MNNRQSGRRRGRGGQRPQGSGGSRDNGNRIDNRARGNAPQLLEKYKNLARDSQMQGDRVLTEYYLQFADHYFRVVSEMRTRQEESRGRRDEWQSDDGDMQDGMDGDMGNDSDDRDGADRETSDRSSNGDRNGGERNGGERNGGERDNSARREPRSPRRDFRRDRNARDDDDRGNQLEGPGTDALPVDILPPAIGVAELPSFSVDQDENIAAVEEEAPRRRGRPRRPAKEEAA